MALSPRSGVARSLRPLPWHRTCGWARGTEDHVADVQTDQLRDPQSGLQGDKQQVPVAPAYRCGQVGHREQCGRPPRARGSRPSVWSGASPGWRAPAGNAAGSAGSRMATKRKKLRIAALVVGGVKPRINGEQHAPGTTRCSAGRQGVTSRQAATRLLRCAPALQVTRRNPLTRLVFMAGSRASGHRRPNSEITSLQMSTPPSCVRHLQALFRRRQHSAHVACADAVLAVVLDEGQEPGDEVRIDVGDR